MTFFSRVFKSKDGAGNTKKSKKNAQANGAVSAAPLKPKWEDAWTRKDVEPEEVQELLRGCTIEMKARALDMPFLLLPFRPASDPSAARTFIRNYFNPRTETGELLGGDHLSQELRLTEPMVLCSVMKWCWSRLAGGVVTWESYELFRVGEQDSNMARDAFATFIPISVESDARTKIIFDFFDLMAAIAAHGKTNGMGGRKLSRLGGWWAFEHADTGSGFEGGYKGWASAADATSHLFFAYLRSLSPDSVQGVNGISALPRSLQTLVQATEYPPERPTLMQTTAPKVVMIVDSVSPTPFALLRRANHFHYRDSDWVLQQFSDYDDPVKALTDECRRVLTSISSTNDSMVSSSKLSTSLGDTSWSRFEDIGFRGLGDESDNEDDTNGSAYGRKPPRQEGLRSTPRSKNDLGRPTTPSWADFLSTGFVDESGNKGPAPLLLPPDKILPPIETNPSRGQSSHSHLRMKDDGSTLEPGELASISSLDLDDAFWWVWMTSLAGEEPTERKAVFGRCAVVETNIRGGKWLVMEEMVKGAAPEPDGGAYIAEKKSIFGFSRRGRMTRSKTTKKTPMLKAEPYSKIGESTPTSKTNIGPDQHAKIQAAAAALQQKQAQQDVESVGLRRARAEDAVSTKTNSVFTLQPVLMSEAAPAMKWANSYDKNAIRAAYLGNNFTGRGSSADLLSPNAASFNVGASTNGSSTPVAKPGPLRETTGNSAQASGHDRKLPALPPSQSDVGLASTAGDRTPTQAAAPLPVAPPKDIRAENQAASEAAQVPLPSATPIEYPRPMERSPQPSRENIHPQQAQPQEPIPQAPSTPETARRQPITDGNSPSSPESKKAAKKLQKKGGAGFKGMFGKSKSNVPRPAPISPSSNSTAVAAARAALQPQQPQQAPPVRKPPPQASVGRRFSGIGRKKAPQVAAQTFTAPVQDFDEGSPAPTAEPSLVSTRPPYNSQHNDYNDSQASLSRVDTNEQRHADREFRAFDQGPLEDQPAFVPQDDSQRESFVSDVPPDDETEHEGNDHVEQDDVSEKSDDLTRRDSPQDRWAQIRKNAAERAARQSEEQSRPSQADRTDDGETSGEETIESRVARIKARVAELTGNMESSGPRR